MWRQRDVMAGYTAWMLLLAAACYLLPGLRAVAWGLLGLSGVTAMVAGPLRHRPARRAPWLLLAAGSLCLLAGQLVALAYAGPAGRPPAFPSPADGCYLAAYPLFLAGLALFIRGRATGRDRRSLADALTVAAGAGLLAWLYLVFPDTRAAGLPGLGRAIAVSYPIGDVLLVALLARLVAPGGWRTRAVQLLTVGGVALLAADVGYSRLLELDGSLHRLLAVSAGWAVLYLAWGAAALHPSMTRLTRPAPRQPAQGTPARLALLLVISLIAPAVLLTEALDRHLPGAAMVAVGSAVLYVLVISRLAHATGSLREALNRTQVLRAAGESLASAASQEQAAAVVRAAVTSLIAAPRPQAVQLAVLDGGTLRLVSAPPWQPAEPPELPREVAEAWLAALRQPGPQLRPATGYGGRQAGAPAAADRVLLCPLTLSGRPAGDPLLGVLATFGTGPDLRAMAGTLELLAHQVALATERIMLSGEIMRRNSQAYFRTLVHDTSDVILIVDDDGSIRYATPSARSLFGNVPVEGVQLTDLVQPGERAEIARALAEMRMRPGLDEDWRITSRAGVYVEVEVRSSDLRHEPTVDGLVLTLRDVTEQRQLERELKYRAFHDSLTGLPNRVLFHDRVVRALVRARRTGAVVAVLFVDLDDFKLINDTMGHSAGDELLVAAGTRLIALAGGSGQVARLGGDEFALLLPDAADSTAADTLAEAIVAAFGEPFPLGAGAAIATATVGVASSAGGTSSGDLVRQADLALYAAKAAGKRQWRRYQPMLSVGIRRRRELQGALDTAIAESGFTVVYQPIVELASGDVVGFEALARWPHPKWGMIPPEQFIAVAEETGHIIPLGSWVLERAAADTVRREQRAPHQPPRYVSVNVSARQLRDPGFVPGVRRVLAAAGLAPSALLLELTESVLLGPDQRIRADLAELRRMGVRLAIDDFGTGYSSLSYLRELPISVLKIDKSFVDGMAVSRQRQALVEVIIRIARTLRLAVVAEGIESEVQRDLLVSMGCRYGQGYLLSGPLPASQAEEMVQAGLSLLPRLPA
ncbi:MAG TPA: EAL domain-containing protein [Streptosporangiaceae bacterium]|nr:EAL domain-containing protein [Streptosporangiaceae bacterium]